MSAFPFTPLQEAWLRDLETTRAKQGTRFLHAYGGGWCCLGRAARIVEKPRRAGFVDEWQGSANSLPGDIWRQLGLRGSLGNLAETAFVEDRSYGDLAGMNDAGMTFREIAAHIRANPENVFTNGAAP